MTTETPAPAPASHRESPVPKIVGWSLSVLIGLLMGVMPVVMLLTAADKMAQGTAAYGYPDGVWKVIVAVEIVSVVLFLIPQTGVLGAILLTAYLGGAVATHVHGPVPEPGNAPAGEPYWFPIVVAVVIWVALLFREPRLRALLPLRSAPQGQ